ncbi:MAG: hypothetical protein WCQ96_03110 [Patescibacteria group bacterium]
MNYVTKEEYNKLREEFDALKAAFYKDNFTAEQIFTKKITFKGDVDFRNNKIGFFSKGTVVQPDFIPSPSGGTVQDTQARSAIDSIRNVLIDTGIIKSS